MYHSWGSQNAWLRQITNLNYLYIGEEVAAKNNNLKILIGSGLKVLVAKIKVQCKIMKGVNKNTVWTWNAIGKEKVWNLNPNAPESNKGFLLNHLISDVLPKKRDGKPRMSNSDPITGQAAWYDLKVKNSTNVIKMKLMAISIQTLIQLKIKPEIIQTLMYTEINLEKNMVKILSVSFKNS